MSEQNGADRTKVQLHLRVGPDVVALLDAQRGVATRNAYAAMILARGLAEDAADVADADAAVDEGGDPVPLAEVEAELAPPSAPKRGARKDGGPAKPPPNFYRCPHPGKRSVGGYCNECESLVSPGGGLPPGYVPPWVES